MQVENAEKSTRRGGTSLVALRLNTSAVLISWTRCSSRQAPLRRRTALQKIHRLSKNIGIAATGVASDIETIANTLFNQGLHHSQLFNSEIPTSRLAYSMAADIHSRTIHRTIRPLGIHACMIGWDEASQQACVFEIDTLGNCFRSKYSCVGKSNKQIALHLARTMNILDSDQSNKKVQSEMSLLVRTGVEALLRGIMEDDEYGEGFDATNCVGVDSLLVNGQLNIAIVGEGASFSIIDRNVLEDAIRNNNYETLCASNQIIL